MWLSFDLPVPDALVPRISQYRAGVAAIDGVIEEMVAVRGLVGGDLCVWRGDLCVGRLIWESCGEIVGRSIWESCGEICAVLLRLGGAIRPFGDF